METLSLKWASQSLLTQSVSFFFILFVLSVPHPWRSAEGAEPARELVKGFEAKPDSSVNSFQSLLTDPTRKFRFGFLRVNRTGLSLAVIHAISSDPLWTADPTRLASWSGNTRVYFNGSLVLSDPSSRVLWSTDTNGDRVVLRNDSNLQVEKLGVASASPTFEWQSFDFPTNTLVENQNFTSAMTLISSNGLYSMRLGHDFIGLYAEYDGDSDQIYWRHKALEAKAKIQDGSGPVYVRINPNGYLGMYQIGNTPVDVEAFNSFQRPINGLLILRLEPDGNLKGYYWDGSRWALNYQAITDTCQLPDTCGPYSLCTPGSGCSCLDNRTEPRSGACTQSPPGPADLCGGSTAAGGLFRVVRRGGVEVPFKELVSHETVSSLEKCEMMCSNNCSCFGAVYNNGSGFCYLVNYPIRTMLGVGDESKVGYFKVQEGVVVKKKKTMKSRLMVGISLLSGALVVLTVVMGYVGYRIWTRDRGVTRMLGEDSGLSPGPYKDLGSASFKSIEMSYR